MSASAERKLEFGGIPGNLAMIFGLPVFTAYLYFAVRFNDGRLLPSADADVDGFFASLVPTPSAAAFYLTWFLVQAALQRWAPGKTVVSPIGVPTSAPRRDSEKERTAPLVRA